MSAFFFHVTEQKLLLIAPTPLAAALALQAFLPFLPPFYVVELLTIEASNRYMET